MKSHVLHTVRCNISAEAAGEIWSWSLLGVKGLRWKLSRVDDVLAASFKLTSAANQFSRQTFISLQLTGGMTMEAFVALNQADELESIINGIKVRPEVVSSPHRRWRQHRITFRIISQTNDTAEAKWPLTLSLPRVINFKFYPAASPEILCYTVWRTWLSIAYSDERWLYYQFSLHHLRIFSEFGRIYTL